MAEAEEIQSRIETIKDLSDRLAEQDRTIKDLEEEMRSETPEHPWSFMKMRRHTGSMRKSKTNERRCRVTDTI